MWPTLTRIGFPHNGGQVLRSRLIGIWKFPAGAPLNQLREAGISWPVPMTETGRGSLFPKC